MAHIAFIGLGNMGGPMAANLVKAGHKVIAFDLVEASRRQAKADGADIADSAAAAVKDAETVITMLPAGKHVLSVWTDVVPAMNKGALIIDCSTIDVESAKQATQMAAKHGIGSSRCAGLRRHRRRQGRDPDLHVRRRRQGVRGGKTGTGEDGQEDRALRRRRRRPGGENLNNMILAISMIAVCEGFALAEKLGLSHQALFDVASTSSGQCWALTSYCPVPGPVPTSPANNDYKPGFAAALMVKDLTLAQDAANAAGPRRRSASTRRRSTRRSTPPAMAAWISRGSSGMCVGWRENNRAAQ